MVGKRLMTIERTDKINHPGVPREIDLRQKIIKKSIAKRRFGIDDIMFRQIFLESLQIEFAGKRIGIPFFIDVSFINQSQ